MKQTLVNAALTVLRRDGPAALTVRSITTEAGCSTTGVYTHFGGKHGLVDEIFVRGFESFDAAVRPALARGDLAEAGRAYRRWALDHPTDYLIMFGRAVPDYVPSDQARERALMSFAQLAESVRSVAPGDDADTRAFHLFATVHGYVMLEISEMSATTEPEAAALFERALRAVAPIR